MNTANLIANAILGAIPKDKVIAGLKRGADFALDKAEDLVDKTENEIDDIIVDNFTGFLRDVFEIEDND